MKSWITGSVIGAALIYFLNPSQGGRRRSALMNKVGPLMGRIPDAPKNLGTQAFSTAQQKAGTAKEAASSAASTVQNAAGGAVSSAQSAATTARDQAASVAQKARETVTKTGSDAVSSAAQSVTEKGQEAVEEAKSATGTASSAQGSTSHSGDKHRGPHEHSDDDNTVRDRIESEIFRMAEFPKGDLNVDVVAGVAHLRGQLDSQEQIADMIDRVREVHGVKDVQSFLHLPGDVPPNKESAVDAS